MHPFLYQAEGPSGPIQVPFYGLLVLSGFMAAFALVHYRTARVGIRPDSVVPLYPMSAIGGFFGARLMYAITIEGWSSLPWSFFTAGGLAFYGGLIGGAVAVLSTIVYLKLPFWKLVDIMGPAVVLALGIGRLGCFMAGCCHGAIAKLDPAAWPILPADGFLDGQIFLQRTFPFVLLVFHGGVGRIHDEPLYPTQLWSATFGIGIALLLIVLWNHRKFDGMIAGLMFLIEPWFRIFAESYRADERGYVVSWRVDAVPAWLPPGFSGAGEGLPVGDGLHPQAITVGITSSQFVGLALFAIGLGIFALRWNKGVSPETPLEDEE